MIQKTQQNHSNIGHYYEENNAQSSHWHKPQSQLKLICPFPRLSRVPSLPIPVLLLLSLYIYLFSRFWHPQHFTSVRENTVYSTRYVHKVKWQGTSKVILLLLYWGRHISPESFSMPPHPTHSPLSPTTICLASMLCSSSSAQSFAH